MNKTTSFRLPEESLEQLKSLSKRFGISKNKVLIFLISDRFNASLVDKNRVRMNKKWDNLSAQSNFESLSKRQIWGNGYNWGWLDFQTRHGDNPYIIDAP